MKPCLCDPCKTFIPSAYTRNHPKSNASRTPDPINWDARVIRSNKLNQLQKLVSFVSNYWKDVANIITSKSTPQLSLNSRVVLSCC